MTFDFKKEYKEFYMPKNKPQIVTIPKANYIAVRGKGNPNEEGGEYKTAIGVLYAVAYTLKMSYKTDYKIEGFFEYVVPPLEGFWWQDNVENIDYTDKSAFNWISVIRLPDFITKKDFDWAVETASKKKKMDCSGAEFLSIDEGLCVQIMHIGAFDDEPATVAMMDKYLEENGYVNDFTDERRHHEIYLSDPRKVAPVHFINSSIEIDSAEKTVYFSILMNQLSDYEIILFFYDNIYRNSDQFIKTLIEHYSLFYKFPNDLLINQSDNSLYDTSAYGV